MGGEAVYHNVGDNLAPRGAYSLLDGLIGFGTPAAGTGLHLDLDQSLFGPAAGGSLAGVPYGATGVVARPDMAWE